MELKELLLEVALGSDGETNKLFNYAIAQVFSPSYIGRINKAINKEIKIKEVARNKDIVAYQTGDTIYINKPVFYNLPREKQLRNLLHEFIHILQNSKNMFIFSKFKEINDVSKNLYKIMNAGLVKTKADFLVGRNMKLLSDGPEEVLAYIMTGQHNWDALTPEAKRAFVKTLEDSGIFNLQTKFWLKRLS